MEMKKLILMLIIVVATVTANAQNYLDVISGKYRIDTMLTIEGSDTEWKGNIIKGWVTINEHYGMLEVYLEYDGQYIPVETYTFNPEDITENPDPDKYLVATYVIMAMDENSTPCKVEYSVTNSPYIYLIQITYISYSEAYFAVTEEIYNRL